MKRSFLLVFLIFLIGFTFIGRLFQLQIIQGKENNPIKGSAVKTVYEYPDRGHIYDRNGKLLVANQLSYDVMIQPNKVKPLDTLEFCKLLKIDKKSFIENFKRAQSYASYKPSVFLKQLAKEDFAYLQEKLSKFKGFYIQKRIIRKYPIRSAANILGYISEVKESTAINSNEYEQGELIGAWGIEKQYEKNLRGIKGKKYLKLNKLNVTTGSYKDGLYDTTAVSGKDLELTIDSDLQKYGELLMTGKRGGIVAIEPSTGEILALITAPSYDPNLMVGRKRRKQSTLLFNDNINKPMIDRGLQASYAPGSPFKMINGLIGLQEGVIDENSYVRCYNGYKYGRRKNAFMGCHCGIFDRPIRFKTALARSCNTYFATTYRKIIDKYNTSVEGINIWAKHANSFGLGNYLGYDLPQGMKGRIPDGDFYTTNYKTTKWSTTYTISNSIGQGEIETTPIQLANVTAAIANKGFYYTPHIVKKIDNKAINNPKYNTKRVTTIDSKYFYPVIDAMYEVYKSGTGKLNQVKGIDICGKTGTVENFTRVNGFKEQLPDHSIFVAFAPKENPKIALAIFVENGGYGSEIAAPITSLMIEKYLNRKISNETKYREKRMIALSLQEVYNKLISKKDSLETRKK